MHARSCLLIVLSTLIAPATAGAATLPARPTTGPAEGVTATGAGKTLTVGFTGASAAWGKAHAGKKVAVECSKEPASSLLFAESETSSLDYTPAESTVAADGASARFTLEGPAGDLCQLSAAPDWTLTPAADTA